MGRTGLSAAVLLFRFPCRFPAKAKGTTRSNPGKPECPPALGSRTSVCGFPFFLQGGEEVGAAVGAKELVVFDQSRDADTRRGERMIDA